MATHDYIIANASGAAVRADLNNALAAIVSNNSNATAPATTYAYQWWADTTAGQLKLRNAANTDWIVVQELDGTVLIESGTENAPGLAFADDVDCGLYRPSNNRLAITTSGVERAQFSSAGIIFNSGGSNVDFRVLGEDGPDLLFVDAGNDHVGIAESAPGTVLEIGSTEPYVTLKNSTEEDTDGGRESRLIFEGEQSGGEISTLAQIEVSHDGTADDEKGKVVISTNDGSDGASPTAALTIKSDQTVAVADNLTVNGLQYPNAGALSNRNIFGNGACRVNQGGASTTGMTSGITRLCVDRFRFFISNLGTWTATSESTDGPESFIRSLKLSPTVADASPASSDYAGCSIAFEGIDFDHVDYGQSTAKPLTISFYVKSNKTGDATFEFFQISGTQRHYTTTYNIASANTWERKIITIPGDTAGEIESSVDAEVLFLWWLNSGTNYTSGSVTNNWQAVDDADRNPSNLGVGGSTSDYWQITGVQVEVGEKATPFEHRNYQDYSEYCHRYFQLLGTIYGCQYGNGSMINAGLTKRMRSAPSVSATFVHTGNISSNFTNAVHFSQYITGDTTTRATGIELDAQL